MYRKKGEITNKELSGIDKYYKRTANRDLTEKEILKQIGNIGKVSFYILRRRYKRIIRT